MRYRNHAVPKRKFRASGRTFRNVRRLMRRRYGRLMRRGR